MLTRQDLFDRKCGPVWQSAKISQGVEAKVYFHLRDSQGKNLDLTNPDLIAAGNIPDVYCEPCAGASYSGSVSYSSCSGFSDSPVDLTFHPSNCFQVRLAAYETLGCNALFDVVGEIVEDHDGYVEFNLGPEQTYYPGLFWVNIGLFQNQKIVRATTALLEIRPTWWGTAAADTLRQFYPITISEVRMAMRDFCGADNKLLLEEEFEDDQIMWAIQRPVDYWNETLPPTGTYSWNRFPFRFHHLNGAVAQLLLSAAMKYDRDHLSYSAGGISVNDKDKGPAYEKRGREMWEEYKTWCRHTKINQNVAMGWGSHLSPYYFRGRYGYGY